jgi:hypothetical protein
MTSAPVYDETPPFDASQFSGLRFYAKSGVDANKTIRIRLVTSDTDPRGGNCAESGPSSDLCFDHFLTQLSLSETWKHYEVSFENFVQSGAGKQFPALALDGLFTIEFLAPSGSDF